MLVRDAYFGVTEWHTSYRKAVRLANASGMVPISRLLLRSRSVTLSRERSEDGSVPTRPLLGSDSALQTHITQATKVAWW